MDEIERLLNMWWAGQMDNSTFKDAVQRMIAGVRATSGHDATGAAQVCWAHKRKDGSGYGGFLCSSENAANLMLADNPARSKYKVVGLVEVATAPSEADKLDAARYRWMIEHGNERPVNPFLSSAFDNAGDIAKDALDAAIDAGIAAEPAQPTKG